MVELRHELAPTQAFLRVAPIRLGFGLDRACRVGVGQGAELRVECGDRPGADGSPRAAATDGGGTADPGAGGGLPIAVLDSTFDSPTPARPNLMNTLTHPVAPLAAPSPLTRAGNQKLSGAASGVRPHQGMPPFDQDGAPLSFFEFWPMWAFYPPVALYAAWLMLRHRSVLLPTVANPSFPGGGFFGESKAEILALAVRHLPEWVAPFVSVDRADTSTSLRQENEAALARLAQAGIELPVVAKPDLGCRGAGVKLVRSRADLMTYLAAFPRGARLLLQRLVPFEGEAGIFYCRAPGDTRGRIVSITLKYFPYVTGDGRRTLRDLIHAEPRAGKLAHLYLRRPSPVTYGKYLSVIETMRPRVSPGARQ
jgi:hypothetical protein